jgi:hypothetical protein
LYAILLPPYVPHTPPISFFYIWSLEWRILRRREHKAPPYAVFSTPLLPRPSYAQVHYKYYMNKI